MRSVPYAVVAADLEGRALESGDFARRFLEDLDRKAAAFGKAHIHALQHCSPVLRFGSPLARLDVQKAVVRIHRVGEHAAELHVRHRFLEPVHVLSHRLEAGFIGLLAHHGQEVTAVLQALGHALDGADHRLERFALLADLLRPLVVLPEGGVLTELDQFVETLALGVEVKDTSEARRSAAPDR